MKFIRKKSIAIDAVGGKNWIGGLYYKKNIIFSIIQNEDILAKYKIIVFTDKENEHIFTEFRDKVKIFILPNVTSKASKWVKLFACIYHNTSYFFPYWGKKFYKYFGITEIYWIADFQECHYPQFFSEELIEQRRLVSSRLVKSKDPLVLSSHSAYKDLTQFFGIKDEIAIVPFVSAIETEVNGISKDSEYEVLEKYKIEKNKYICICNQFWQHKNHVVVLRMIKLLAKKYPEHKMQFLFTGELKDYRNQSYFNVLKELFNDPDVSSRCKLLGFIDRQEQIILIKNSNCLIQPSLFEGWGTVLEDAKVLDKLVLLSDIPVHREQKNKNCILFNPHNPENLLERVIQAESSQHTDNVEKGLVEMYKNARKYSKNFERLIRL